MMEIIEDVIKKHKLGGMGVDSYAMSIHRSGRIDASFVLFAPISLDAQPSAANQYSAGQDEPQSEHETARG